MLMHVVSFLVYPVDPMLLHRQTITVHTCSCTWRAKSACSLCCSGQNDMACTCSFRWRAASQPVYSLCCPQTACTCSLMWRAASQSVCGLCCSADRMTHLALAHLGGELHVSSACSRCCSADRVTQCALAHSLSHLLVHSFTWSFRW